MTETIHVGDFVRVKDWDTIKREFGVHKTSGGLVIAHTCFSFTHVMADELCGKTFTVTGISTTGEIEGHGTGWVLSSDVLELINLSSDEDDPQQFEALTRFLENIMVK
jgi:hypothetical protein